MNLSNTERPFSPARSVICPVLIGREDALDTARAVLSRARSGGGGVLLISGEAGIGKSRLLREAAETARAHGFIVLQGACFETDRAVPFAPLLDLVRRFATSTSPAVAAHAFAPAAAELVRGFPELTTIFPALPTLKTLEPEQERRRLFQSIMETLSTLGRSQPVLVAIEDMHWGDEASLDLLLHLARRVDAQPIALALSYRNDEVAAPLERLLAELDRTRVVTELPLARFSSAELATMVSAIFDGGAPGGGFVATMFALTEGNPFFVEEVLKSLIIAGDVARRDDGAWVARPLARIEAPRTAVEAVRRRLSALSVPARDIASIAAVIGRGFDFVLLQALTGHDERALLALIRELIHAQLVTEESSDRFAFRHALTREAILGELLVRERAAMHRLIADELERHDASGNANIEALAYHAYGAMDWPRAYAASSRAADHALALYAPREALAHIDRALIAADRAELAQDAMLHHARGRALETVGDLHGAHAEFTTALEIARTAGRETEAWEALHALGILWSARDYERAGEYRRDALALARMLGLDPLIARSLNRIANWHVNLEQPAPARRIYEEALAIFERLDDKRGIAETVDLLAMTHFISGDIALSAMHYERSVILHEQLGDARRVSTAIALLQLCAGSSHTSCTSFGGQAIIAAWPDATERPLRLAREIGWRAGEAFALYTVADALAWRGAYDRALPMIHEALAIAEEMQHLQWLCGAACELGRMLLDLETPQAARDPLERACTIARRLGSRTWFRWTAAPLAIALARLGELDAANALLDEAAVPATMGREALLPGDEDSPTLGERGLEIARAEVALVEMQPSRALVLVERRLAAERIAAARAFANGRAPSAHVAVSRLSYVRALALIALDNVDEADRALQRAHEEAVADGARPLLWRIDAAIGVVLRKRRLRVQSRQAFGRARQTAGELAASIADHALRDTFLRAVDVIAPPAPTPSKRQRVNASFSGLTARERDVARLIAEGKANRAIAHALGIGERTVEGYVAGALAKLGFSTRARLAAWTVERGLSAPKPH